MFRFARKTSEQPRRASHVHRLFANGILASVSTHVRAHRLRSAGVCSLALAAIVGASSVVPTARPTTINAPAAAFATAGLIGTVGDVSSVPDTLLLADWSMPGGTLAFGDPANPQEIPVLVMPGDDEGDPPDEDIPETDGEAPAEAAPAPEAAPTEAAPAPEAAPAEAAPAPAAAPVEAAPAPAPAASGAPVAARGVRASDIARTLVGRPYRWGAAGPRAFDCSGLTLYIYKQLGISLPHKASSQFNSRYGRVISSMNDLAPGDLVYFRNTAGRGITHAAIYVGGGKMVTANSPRQGVRLSSINDAYWRRHWAGGIRPGG
jgi:cell wall-associated NlpC family hydrolase